MEVRVIGFGSIRDLLGEGRNVQLPDGATVGDLVDRLSAREARLHLVIVDGERADLRTELSEGAEVTLMPPFAGGST